MEGIKTVFRADQVEFGGNLEYLEHNEWCKRQKVQCNFQ